MPDETPSDETLVAQAQRGDRAAFGRLVERHQDALFGGISRMVRRREDAEDLAQEAFVKAFRNMARFQGRSSFYTWLFSIASNAVISHRRKMSARRRSDHVSLSERGDSEGQRDLTAPGDPPEAAAQRAEMAERIEQAIAELDDEFRTVVVLRDIQEFDYQTMAHILDCPKGTVKSRLHRARLALREKLKDLVR
jgi:RNA polymerase sigma-70 factor (ECF subfamily)